MTALTQDYQITWEKLPDDYKLPDDPVDNINQLALAAALTQGNLLLWGGELAEQERQHAERLAAQLRAAGIEPEV